MLKCAAALCWLSLFFPATLQAFSLPETLVIATCISPTPKPSSASPSGQASDILQNLQSVDGLLLSDSVGSGRSGLSANLRGTGNDGSCDTPVILNGVPLNSFIDNRVPWESLALSDSSEVRKGEYAGASALELNSAVSQNRAQRRLIVEAGSFSRLHTALSGSLRSCDYDMQCSIDRDRSSGYREHSAYRNHSAAMHLQAYPNSFHRWTIDTLFSESFSQFPGSLSEEEAKTNPRQASANGYGDLHNRLGLVCLKHSSILDSHHRFDSSFYMKQINASSSLTQSFRSDVSEQDFGTSLKWQAHHSWGDFAVGMDLRSDAASSLSNFDSFRQTGRRNESAIFMQSLLIFPEKWSWSQTFRLHKAQYHLNLSDYQGSLNYQGISQENTLRYTLNSSNSFFASARHSFELPSLFEINAVSPDYLNNTHIHPQSAKSFEIGWEKNSPCTAIKMAAFESFTDREILFNALDFQNQNFDTLRRGLEFSLQHQFTERLRLEMHSLFMQAFFKRGPFAGKRMPLVPEEQHRIAMAYRLNALWTLRLEWMGVYNQIRANDFQGHLKANNYTLWNAALEYSHKGRYMFLRLNNLTNTRYSTWPSSNGIHIERGENPMPGRHVLCGFTQEF